MEKVINRLFIVLLTFSVAGLFGGCRGDEDPKDKAVKTISTEEPTEYSKVKNEMLHFVDAHGKWYDVDIDTDVARTDDVSGEQFTQNAIAFCEKIKEAGYKPMIYSNMYWEAFLFDMSRLADIPIWYADYELEPQTPYKFEYWQFTEKGKVSGIANECDIDIQFIEVP